MVCLASAAPAAAQAWSIEPRLGVAAPSALYDDPGVAGLDPIEISAAAAPELGVAVRTVLDARWMLEAELHYAPGRLRASDADGDRTVSDLNVLGGAVLVRRTLGRVEAVAGAGALKYDAPDGRAWEDGASLLPAARLGLAVPIMLGGRRARVEATARVHRHQTTLLEAAGTDAATLVRLGAHVALELGGAR